MMRQPCRVAVVSAVLAVCLAPIVGAQLSDDYASWADGPEGFLLTDKEKRAWAEITSDTEAERFIALFWARRNPNPSSSFNVFRADFERRVRFADEHFSFGDQRGSLSARGRVLILMGAPDRRQVRGIEGAPSVGAVSGDTGAVENNTEAWYYDPQNLPPGFKAKGAQLYFLFYEEKLDSNSFELDRTNRESFKAMNALSRAPEAYLLHPELTEVPIPVSVVGAWRATAAHLAWLDVDEAPFDDSAIVISELGVADVVHRPLWVHIELPPAAPELDLLIGRVMRSDGETVSNFEMSADPMPGQNGKFYHLTFPLQEGSYSIDLVGVAASEPQVARHLVTEVSSIPTEGTWLSPLWLGVRVAPTPEASHGSAFTIGGWHLTPISGPELKRSSEITYLGFVVRPAFDEAGAVDLLCRIDVKKDGVSIGRPFELPLDVSRVVGDLYMYGNAIALTGLPDTGPYELVFQVTEAHSDTTVERTLSLEITD